MGVKIVWEFDETMTKKDVIISTILSSIIVLIFIMIVGYISNMLGLLIIIYFIATPIGCIVNYMVWINKIKNKRFSTAFTRKEVS